MGAGMRIDQTTETEQHAAELLLSELLDRGTVIGVEVPAALRAAMLDLLGIVARGDTPVIASVARDLTTQQAADLLNVSRPHVIRLIDKGELPAHRVGTHRRIELRDLLEYREHRNAERHRVIRELADDAQRLGIYD